MCCAIGEGWPDVGRTTARTIALGVDGMVPLGRNGGWGWNGGTASKEEEQEEYKP